MKDSLKNFNILLILFCLVEILIFKADSFISFSVTIVIYCLIVFKALKNLEEGIFYFLSLTLLSVGIGNYSGFNELPNNFWGIRIFNFSLNILFSLILVSVYIFKLNKGIKIDLFKNSFNKFLLLFILYNIIIGMFSLSYSINYFDNYLNDCLTYLPFFVYLVFISNLSNEILKRIFIETLIASLFFILFSFIFNKKLTYGNDEYLLQNTVTTVLPLTIFFFRKELGNTVGNISILIVISAVLTSNLFISGKLWIIIFIMFIYLLLTTKRFRVFSISILISVFFIIGPLFEYVLLFFSNTVIGYKLSQIHSLFTLFSFDILSHQETSLGNLVAEFRTIFNEYSNDVMYFLFGKGFGGGISDNLGLLSKWVELEGYSILDYSRNNYYKMHLPVLEIFVKSGIFFCFYYLYIFTISFSSSNKFSILFFFLFCMFFYVSKEYLLYTILVYKLLEINKIK